MHNYTLTSLALLGGILLAVQGGFNSQLSTTLKSPIHASLVSFSISTILAALTILMSSKRLPSTELLHSVPGHLWFSGALFSFIGICLYYYTIPRLGISTMISLGLTGQLIISIIAGHFGWFGLPMEPVTIKRIIGAIAMIIGIILINHQK